MDLATHYDQLYQTSLPKIASGNVEVDGMLNSKSDNRYGITLLIRPPEAVKIKIQQFLDHLKIIDPHQYYYRSSDIHVTVLSIISCYSGFQLEQIYLPDYVAVIKKSLAAQQPFEIIFKGITASPSSILIQGFLPDSSLNYLRDSLRENFKNSALEQTIDKRYSLQTAHATVVHFQNRVSRPKEFVQVLDKHRNVAFGTFFVDSLELVFNDWYQRAEKVQTLDTFLLNLPDLPVNPAKNQNF